jgi:hypothetical protein
MSKLAASYYGVEKAIRDLKRRAEELAARPRVEYIPSSDIYLRRITKEDDPEKILDTLDSIQDLNKLPSGGRGFAEMAHNRLNHWIVITVNRNNPNLQNIANFFADQRYATKEEATSYVPKQNDSSVYIRNVTTKETFLVLMK